MTRSSLALGWIVASAVAGGMGCEVLTPAPPPVVPQAGYYLSTPFADVRALNDILALSPTLIYAVGTKILPWSEGQECWILRRPPPSRRVATPVRGAAPAPWGIR